MDRLIMVITAIVCTIVAILALLIRYNTYRIYKKVTDSTQDTGDTKWTRIKAFFQRFLTIRDHDRFHKLAKYVCILAVSLFTSTVFAAYNKADHEKMCSFMISTDEKITQDHENRVQKYILETADKAVQRVIANALLSSTTNNVAIKEVRGHVKNNQYVFNKNRNPNTPPLYLISPAYLDKDGNPRFLTQDERKEILICIGKAGGIDAPLTTIMMEVLECEELMNNLKLDYASEGITLEYYDKLAIVIGYINGQKDKESKK